MQTQRRGGRQPSDQANRLGLRVLRLLEFFTFVVLFCSTAEFDSKDLVQDLNRLLQFAPGSQPNAAILREFFSCV